ncbi:PucR family transcriptional regulator [Tessaracoccus oleiagri]|uniref:PucR C-terminal helix-turn-helix domain-containing protein n=1 Tax=Tessaracoccus oleiagri TaxID=686624 RepID=A0A1G9LWN0_9ACTN|nr:helix-turn-helix domain-containing protein [Tessaracoccus oleiagri]SDL66131.1 PucR C-terminal helix-turn-helix domain-containing protein [Tessaracoccus oleiagri]
MISNPQRSASAPTPVQPVRGKAGLVKRFRAVSSEINTATIAALDARHPWFTRLDADSRSWISMVARTGIDGFVTWLAGEHFDPESIFEVAPRLMARRISLRQTVDLVRTTTEVVEEQIGQLLPRNDRPALQLGILQYSREVAFAAAAIYARAAEARGAWDSRIEASVIDAVVRAETDESVLSRASTLGWDTESKVTVAIGGVRPDTNIDVLRRAAGKVGLDMLASPQGERLVCIFGGRSVTSPVETSHAIDKLHHFFAEGPVVIGPVVDSLAEASQSAREAASGYRAARAWPEGPTTLLSGDLLPERALSGDGHARRMLASEVYGALASNKELLETAVSFLDHGSSMEATARAMFVHPNTVRYRLKRITEITGYNPANSREAYILRMAITLGRLQNTRA